MRITALSAAAMSLGLAAWVAAADEGHSHEQGEQLEKVDFPVTATPPDSHPATGWWSVDLGS
jgi:hypothetical protein